MITIEPQHSVVNSWISHWSFAHNDLVRVLSNVMRGTLKYWKRWTPVSHMLYYIQKSSFSEILPEKWLCITQICGQIIQIINAENQHYFMASQIYLFILKEFIMDDHWVLPQQIPLCFYTNGNKWNGIRNLRTVWTTVTFLAQWNSAKAERWQTLNMRNAADSRPEGDWQAAWHAHTSKQKDLRDHKITGELAAHEWWPDGTRAYLEVAWLIASILQSGTENLCFSQNCVHLFFNCAHLLMEIIK